MSQAQLESYQQIRAELGRRQREVLSLLERYNLSGQEIATELGLPLHSISGRITELVRRGKVQDSGSRRFNVVTKRWVTVWKVRTK